MQSGAPSEVDDDEEGSEDGESAFETESSLGSEPEKGANRLTDHDCGNRIMHVSHARGSRC